jgi:thymidylate kinase
MRAQNNTAARTEKMSGQVVILEAIPGSGKMTITRCIARDTSAVTLPEAINVDFFDLMMDSPEQLFAFQIATLAAKIERIKHAIALAEATGATVFVDRGVVGDYVFAASARKQGHITDEQWRVYNSMALETPREALPSAAILAHVRFPHVPPPLPAKCSVRTVFLDVTPQVALARVLTRGNAQEASKYDLPYFQQLRDSLLAHLDADKIIIVPYSDDKMQGGTLQPEDVELFLKLLQ